MRSETRSNRACFKLKYDSDGLLTLEDVTWVGLDGYQQRNVLPLGKPMALTEETRRLCCLETGEISAGYIQHSGGRLEGFNARIHPGMFSFLIE